MTVGQEFHAFGAAIESEIALLRDSEKYLYHVNMGATAVGTGLNAPRSASSPRSTRSSATRRPPSSPNAHANMSPDVISDAVQHGAKGLVIVGVGDGNMTAPAIEAVKAATAKGIVVVRSSRTNGGLVRRNIEVSDDDLGTVASMELNPGKARVLLQLALLKSKDTKVIQGYFDRY
jgi:L-asparaginase/Glu-tRNA(Gln) amidotransferase subunit D